MAAIQEGAFKISTAIDDDGHLSVYVEAADGSELIPMNEDVGRDSEFGERFSTSKIEREYKANNEQSLDQGAAVGVKRPKKHNISRDVSAPNYPRALSGAGDFALKMIRWCCTIKSRVIH